MKAFDGTAIRRAVMFAYWMKLSVNSTMLALEAQTVIGLRLMMLGEGGTAAHIEVHRMVVEKASALIESTATLANGGSAHKLIVGYRRRVRANSRRLLKGRESNELSPSQCS